MDKKQVMAEIFADVGITLGLMLKLQEYCTNKELDKSWKELNRQTNKMLAFRDVLLDYRFAK